MGWTTPPGRPSTGFSKHARLAPLPRECHGFRLGALYLAELRLLLKGRTKLGYTIGLGLVAAQVLSPLEAAHHLLVAAWAWPTLLLSELGSREIRHDTRQMVFSAPHPLARQLPASWLAAFSIIAFLGAGSATRFLLAGDVDALRAWLAGALFVPSLALALGVLTGSGKTFQVLYALWVYMTLQKLPALDFAGVTPESPWRFYGILAALLVGAATLARWRQLTWQGTSR